MVAVAASDVALADALAAVHVASLVLVSSLQVAAAHLAAVRVLFRKVPVAVLALVATATFDEALAVALAGLDATRRVGTGVANAVVQRAAGITVARQTDVRVVNGLGRVLRIKLRFSYFDGRTDGRARGITW